MAEASGTNDKVTEQITTQEKATQEVEFTTNPKELKDLIKASQRNLKSYKNLRYAAERAFEERAKYITLKDDRASADFIGRHPEFFEAELPSELQQDKNDAIRRHNLRIDGTPTERPLKELGDNYKKRYSDYQGAKLHLTELEERLKAAKNGTEFDASVLTAPKLLKEQKVAGVEHAVDAKIQDVKLGKENFRKGPYPIAHFIMTDEAQEAFEKAHKAKQDYREAKSQHAKLPKGAGSKKLASEQYMVDKKQDLAEARAERGKYGETAGDVRRYFKEFVMKEINSVRDDANSYFDKFKSRANSGKGPAEDPTNSGRGGR